MRTVDTIFIPYYLSFAVFCFVVYLIHSLNRNKIYLNYYLFLLKCLRLIGTKSRSEKNNLLLLNINGKSFFQKAKIQRLALHELGKDGTQLHTG